jgi:hypothetical protein
MATVRDFVRNDLPPQTHAYDDPAIGPIEFLTCVMHATHLPMSVRIHAASALLPFTDPKPRATAPISCKIVIEGMSTDPEGINTDRQLNSRSGKYNRQPSSGGPGSIDTEKNSNPSTFKPFLSTPGPSYIEKTFPSLNTESPSNPPSFIDYSKPLTPTELDEVKAAVHELQPNFDPSQPVHLYLCACGHWLTFPCDCIRHLKSRMN